MSPAVIADLNGDGRPEVIAGAGDGYVYAFDSEGNNVEGWPTRGGDYPITTPVAIADIDGSGGREVIVVSGSPHVGTSQINVIGENGRSLRGFPLNLASAVAAAPLAADVEGDGLPEAVITALNGDIYAFDGDGNSVKGFPFKAAGGEVTATPAIADIDNDGRTDIFIATQDGYLTVFDLGITYDKTNNPWPMYQGDIWRTGKFRTGDGQTLDFAVEAHKGGVTVKWNAPSSSNRDGWRILRASGKNGRPGEFSSVAHLEQALDGRYEFFDGDVDYAVYYYYEIQEYQVNGESSFYGPKIVKTPNKPSNVSVKSEVTKAFPNPFADKITISYRVGEPDCGEINLLVYDLAGKLVRNLDDGASSPGDYSTTWDGRDESGRELPSGVYTCQLRNKDTGAVSSKNVVLVR